MSRNGSRYIGALLEEMNDRLQKVQEALGALTKVPTDLRRTKERQDDLDEWRDIAKSVIKDQSQTLNNHEVRLTKLETT